MPTRRTVLKFAAGSLAALGAPAVHAAAPHVVVIGAGAFGGWTAWSLARRGARVTIVDAWGPGNMRASSGGETRVIRGSYGDRAIYTRMAARALGAMVADLVMTEGMPDVQFRLARFERKGGGR